jgi:hypothetical protein
MIATGHCFGKKMLAIFFWRPMLWLCSCINGCIVCQLADMFVNLGCRNIFTHLTLTPHLSSKQICRCFQEMFINQILFRFFT